MSSETDDTRRDDMTPPRMLLALLIVLGLSTLFLRWGWVVLDAAADVMWGDARESAGFHIWWRLIETQTMTALFGLGLAGFGLLGYTASGWWAWRLLRKAAGR